jgi:transposase InsO family protein
MQGHKYLSDLYKPQLIFNDETMYTVSVQRAHKILKLLPISATKTTSHRSILLHSRTPYDPPTYINNTLFASNTNLPNTKTPTAFIYHLRFACASTSVLKHTHQHVKGMTIQQGSWKDIKEKLPCNACLAGKMQKTRKATSKDYVDIGNLVTLSNVPLSWTPSTVHKITQPNLKVDVDWGIINKRAVKGLYNVFALFLDINTGFTFVYPAENRSQAGISLLSYIQTCGQPQVVIHDNAKEFISGQFHQMCLDKGIKQEASAPYTPNQNPVEQYMNIIAGGAHSLLYISSLPHAQYWHHPVEHKVQLQNRTALPGRCTPYEMTNGRQPNVGNLRIFGSETMAFVEKDQRTKWQDKADKCIYLGISPLHSDDTHKLFHLRTNEVIYRRNVCFNERSFPARQSKLTLIPNKDTGADLIGQQFVDEGTIFLIIEADIDENGGGNILTYEDVITKERHYSTVKEVRSWYENNLQQSVTAVQPSRLGFMNRLANTTYQAITKRQYNLQLTKHTKAPKSYKQASNLETQWFEAEQKEKDGMLRFNTWSRLPQASITPLIRQRALRAHYIYNVKRNGTAKARVGVNGRRQHEDTFSETTSPVASQLQLRILLLISAFCNYKISQMDLTNVYLHADIKHKVFIVISEGFPGAGEVVRLDKATYGTKQGARRFYDHTQQTLNTIGREQCPNEPCLFRLLHDNKECFPLPYVDDALITGQPTAVKYLQTKLSEHFDSKFETPKDFLGLDITRQTNGTIQLSMHTFTKKLTDTFKIIDDPNRTILTPGRVDRKNNSR